MDWLFGTIVGGVISSAAWAFVVWGVKPLLKQQEQEKATPSPKPIVAPEPLTQAELRQMSETQLDRRIRSGEDRMAKAKEAVRLETREVDKCKSEKKRRAA